MRLQNTFYLKFVAALFVAFIFYLECFVKNNKDFDIFIGASKLVFEGNSCYNVWLKSGTEGLKYFYSPLFAILLFPLKDSPQLVYNFIWTGITVFFLYRSFTLLTFFLPISKLASKIQTVFFGLVVLTSLRYILDNLDLGQMTPFLLWASLESIKCIYSKKTITGAALLALAINIKLIPIAILAYLLYKKEWKAVSYTVLFFILFLFIPAMVIGYDFNSQLLDQWMATLTDTTVKSIHDDAGRPGLSSFIPSLVMDTPIKYSFHRNFLHLNELQANYVLNGFRLIFILMAIYLMGRPFQKVDTKKSLFYDLSLVCVFIPLVFPHQGKYSFLYLLPAYAYCIYSLIRMQNMKPKIKYTYRWCLWLLILSFILVTATTDGLIGRKASDFTEYLHLISYGSFCLLGVLILLKPKRSLSVSPKMYAVN